MKRYVIAMLVVLQMNNVEANQKFRQKFLNWEQSLSVSQKESLKNFITDYNKAYVAKNKDLLPYFESALEKIMDQWDALYKPLTDAQTFHDSVKKYVASHPKDGVVKQYVAAYNKFDQMPTDKKLYSQLQTAQKKLQKKMSMF